MQFSFISINYVFNQQNSCQETIEKIYEYGPNVSIKYNYAKICKINIIRQCSTFDHMPVNPTDQN
jgi:hypothetical protein